MKNILFFIIILLTAGCIEKTVEYEKSKDATLSELKVSDYTLEPKFSEDIFEYSITVDEDTKKIYISAFENNGKAIVNGDGLVDITDNQAKIIVIAENENRNEYIINVNRKIEKDINYIKVNEDEIDLIKGESFGVNFEVFPVDAEYNEISHEILNESIVEISSKNTLNTTVTALDIGQTRIQANIGGIYRNINVNIRSKEQNKFTIHYSSNDYEKYGIFLAGGAIESNLFSYKIDSDGDGEKEVYDYDNLLQFSNYETDDFGKVINIDVDETKNMWFCIAENRYGYIERSENYIDLEKYNEVWLYEGVNRVYYKKPENAVTEINLYSDSKNIDEINLKEDEQILIDINTYPIKLSSSSLDIEITDSRVIEYEIVGEQIKIIPKDVGYTNLRIWANGLNRDIPVDIYSDINNNSIRIHLKRFEQDYFDFSMLLDDKEYGFYNSDSFGMYFDYNIGDITEIHYKLKNDDEIIQEGELNNLNPSDEIWFTEGRSGYSKIKPKLDKGAFKIVNSWGANGNWENEKDGFFWLTYDALKKSGADVFLIKDTKKENNQKVVAAFKLAGLYRGGFEIYFGKYNNDDPNGYLNPTKEIEFISYPWISKGYYYTEYPANMIAFDVSELLPLDNEKIYMKIVDYGNSNKSVEVQDFSVELYDSYNINGDINSLENCTQHLVYDYYKDEITTTSAITTTNSGVNIYTTDGMDNYFTTEAINFGNNDPISPSGVIKRDSNNFRENYTYVDTDNINYKRVESSSTYASIDLSTRDYFPPVNSQEAIGGCTAWSLGYYISTYNTAKLFEYDLSNIKLTDGQVPSDYKDKIMSPQFLYSLINEGVDGGSNPYTALKVLIDIGIASTETMPIGYYSEEQSLWGDEEAWREAILHKADEDIQWTYVNNDNDIQWIKNKLNNGYLLAVGVNGYSVQNHLSANDVLSYEYISSYLTHLVTICGFDDNKVIE